jgi:phosphohistidine phosphatase SixA
MTLRHVLLRHASAGDRAEWDDDDRVRPLDERGRRQAEGIVEPLLELGVRRVVSSPYLRCTQSVEPLAQRLGAKIELDEALAEGAAREETFRLLQRADEPTVFCTHGDVVENVLAEPLKKGAAAVLEVDEGGAVHRVAKIKRRE